MCERAWTVAADGGDEREPRMHVHQAQGLWEARGELVLHRLG